MDQVKWNPVLCEVMVYFEIAELLWKVPKLPITVVKWLAGYFINLMFPRVTFTLGEISDEKEVHQEKVIHYTRNPYRTWLQKDGLRVTGIAVVPVDDERKYTPKVEIVAGGINEDNIEYEFVERRTN
ncbi:unnamed protein product [Darwinula stevensoni]|uniref:Uncharacterized protein n=1 Tax=Darwinula stevensoni TaxID=69355 RepID=A0A7R9AE11_9CRUS|nr:unnamed protein product [Darwinula stevensoni]CAG0901857.1 unnamed protein product [Darwinula stevensoni]